MKIEEPPDWMKKYACEGMPNLEPRQYVWMLDLEFDVNSQLDAIVQLLRLHERAEQDSATAIKRIEEDDCGSNPELADWRDDELISAYHESVYQDAAHSMAAAGMLAPLIEAIFFQSFQGMRTFFDPTHPPSGHIRWTMKAADAWDCHRVAHTSDGKTGVVAGILELADAVGLRTRLPADLADTLGALFYYRNKMFHHGFEWPVGERTAFESNRKQNGWPDGWFRMASIGSDPWVFYMSKEFIDHCLESVDRVLAAIGEFVRDELLPNNQPPSNGERSNSDAPQ